MTFELGVNYWPRGSAMYMWREFDIGEIREDMARIAEIGFDVVRMFVLMKDFMPQHNLVSSAMLDRLTAVASAARDEELKVVPTLIVLNMSGRIWWPDWMLAADGSHAKIYSDPAMLASQTLLVQACVRALAGDAAIRAFDIANEIDDAQRPDSRDAAQKWTATLANAIRREAPRMPIQIGAHLPSLTRVNNMRLDDLSRVVDENVMHAYPLYSDAAQSYVDTELVPFSCALTSALSNHGGATLMQEFGLCTAPPGAAGSTIVDNFLGQPRSQYLASEDEATEYYQTVLGRLTATGAAGAYAWCYGDYDSRLFDRPPFATAIRERTFGLIRADGTEKPAADVIREFRKRRDTGKIAMPDAPVAEVLDISADEYYSDPSMHFSRLYSSWLARES